MFSLLEMAQPWGQVPQQAAKVRKSYDAGTPNHGRLCSSCYVNHHNHASQDAKKKYDRSRKRSMSEKRTV